MTDVEDRAPFVRGSDTSEAAADAIEPDRETLRERVRLLLVKAGDEGLTDQEMQTALGMGPQTQTPRRIELVRRNLVVDSGRTRPTRKGRQAVVWVFKASES